MKYIAPQLEIIEIQVERHIMEGSRGSRDFSASFGFGDDSSVEDGGEI